MQKAERRTRCPWCKGPKHSGQCLVGKDAFKGMTLREVDAWLDRQARKAALLPPRRGQKT